ncbi:MAG: type II toxin-antitoxin system RelE family toxin [Thermoanaerobaculia bacterium]
MTYRIRFAESVKGQLRKLSAGERAQLLDAIEQQLSYEPLVETRNRKPLRPNPVAPWELRVGDLRAFYEVAAEANEVLVLAVGRKRGHRLWIGDEEVRL